VPFDKDSPVIVGDNLGVYYGDEQATTYGAKVSYSNTYKIYLFFFYSIINIRLNFSNHNINLCITQYYNQAKEIILIFIIKKKLYILWSARERMVHWPKLVPSRNILP